MKAEEALRQSESRQIVAETTRGLITMYRAAVANSIEMEVFALRLTPHDAHGQLNGANAVAIGSYEDLDIAVTIAAIGYGVGETQWAPARESPLAVKVIHTTYERRSGPTAE